MPTRKSLSECYENTGKISDLIEAAEYQLEYTQEDAVGYYYYWMLQALKNLNGDDEIVELRTDKKRL